MANEIRRKGAPRMGPNRTQPNPPRPPKGVTRNPLPKGTPKKREASPEKKISVAKYDEMAEAYFAVQSAGYVAEKCDVNMKTAVRYLDKGDPVRGLPPIRERFISARKKVQKATDRSWAKAMAEDQQMLLRAKSALLTGLVQVQSVDVPSVLSLDDMATLARSMEILVRTESFAYGGPDSRVETTGSTGGIGDWTVDEIKRYIADGKRPDRLAKVLTAGGKDE